MSVTPYVNEREREWVSVMAPAVELAKQVANTEFVPKSLRGNGAAIVAAILYGDELGLGPMQALAKIAVIDGRPSLSAETQRALILAAGHDIWLVEATTTKVTIAGRRSGSDHTSSVTWTLDDAKRAGLAGRQNWRMYPRQMLTARATAELARLIFADAIGGLAATEEIEAESVIDDAVEAKPVGNRRRRRATATTPETSEVTEVEQPLVELPPLPDEPFEILPNGAPADDDILEAEPEVVERPVITKAQRARLFGIATEYGVTKEHLRDLVKELTGTESTAGMTVETYDELVALIQSRLPVNA